MNPVRVKVVDVVVELGLGQPAGQTRRGSGIRSMNPAPPWAAERIELFGR